VPRRTTAVCGRWTRRSRFLNQDLDILTYGGRVAESDEPLRPSVYFRVDDPETCH